MFIQNTTYVNLLLFLQCASRLEHVGLNKYFWHRAYLQSYNDVFHNASYSTGGWGQHFFNSEGAKINDSLGPPGVRPPGYAPEIRQQKFPSQKSLRGTLPPPRLLSHCLCSLVQVLRQELQSPASECEFHHFSKLTLLQCLLHNLFSFKFSANLTSKNVRETILFQA